MTPPLRPRTLGYESPTGQTGPGPGPNPLAANHLIRRLHDLGPHTVDQVVAKPEKHGRTLAVSVKDRLACFQWTWFTSTMATGGIANVIASSESRYAIPLALARFLFKTATHPFLLQFPSKPIG